MRRVALWPVWPVLLLGLLTGGPPAGSAATVPDRTPTIRIDLSRPPGPLPPVLPYTVLEFAVPGPVQAAEAWVPGVRGRAERQGARVRFVPDQPFLPGAVHPVTVWVRRPGERVDAYRVALPVDDLGGRLWVDVDLSVPQRVRVFRGRHLVRAMLASAGRPGDETPLGLYRVQDRGRYFWSARYRQGAYCWVRFLGNYLFHSLPVDREGRVLEEERRRLGLPASHGCIRLDFEDARWFYRNVPAGTPVFIHR